jgi:hypothetical protein
MSHGMEYSLSDIWPARGVNEAAASDIGLHYGEVRQSIGLRSVGGRRDVSFAFMPPAHLEAT